MSPRLLSTLALPAVLCAAGPLPRALAQGQPGTLPTGGGQNGPEPKPEGAAEEAPSTPGALPTTPVLPPPHGKNKEFQLIELNGYYRFRGDWFKKFNLGFNDLGDGGAPFPRPLACTPNDPSMASDKPCEDTLKSANMRLRLEPIIHIDEKTSVHIQADLLDNVVYGSTPAGFFGDGTPRPGDIPSGGFTDNQAPPIPGRNSLTDSILIKRAWAEVETPFGLLKFGRQPNQWGLGIMWNSGDRNPIHGTYDLDADYGDTVDRVSFDAGIPGTDLRGSIAMDWGSTAPTAGQTDLFADTTQGQPWDLDDNDDVNQWTFTLSRLDTPTDFLDKEQSGEVALNYGARVVYRSQKWEQLTYTLGETPDPTMFVQRDYTAYLPDLWARFGWGNLELEAEGVAVLGSIDHAADLGTTSHPSLDIREYGGVLKGLYKFLDGSLRLGGETGYASGDQWDNNPQGATNVLRNGVIIPGPGDKTVNRFLFDPDYKIDLILFRELLGTINNAIYLRPSVEYDFNKHFHMRVQNVTSFAAKRVSTPGNGIMYGTEFDGDLSYTGGGFTAGAAYGVLFPLGAMAHPADFSTEGGPGFNYGNNSGDASAAQTIQFRLSIKF